MAFKTKPDHPSKLLFLFRSHHFRTYLFKRKPVWRGPCLRILLKSRKIIHLILPCVAQQRKTVIKNRRRCHNFSRVIIPQKAKIAKMTVFIINQRIIDQHTTDLLTKLRPQLIIIIQTLLNSSGTNDPANRDIRRIHIGKQHTLGGSAPLPIQLLILKPINLQQGQCSKTTYILFP